MKALIIVDIQNDFINGSLKVDNSEEIIEKINKIKKNYDLVILTQDSHPKNHISFASNHNMIPFKEKIINYNDIKYNQIMWPDHCIKNSYGEEFHKDLLLTSTDIIVKKGENCMIDSYSAFFDNLKLNETKLDSILNNNNVKEIDICGLAFDYCVKFTALDSIELGYKTNILYNLTRSVDPNNDEQNILFLKDCNINIIFDLINL